MPSLKRLFGLLILTLAWSSASARSEIIVEDHFDDGIRDRHEPPRSLAYFGSESPRHLVEVDGKLILNSVGANRFLVAAVGEPGDYIEISDGETLSLEFEFRMRGGHGGAARQLRVAWLNSGIRKGDPLPFDFDGFPIDSRQHMDFSGYQGAIRVYQPDSNRPVRIMKRIYGHEDLLMKIDSDSGYTELANGGSGAISSDVLNTMQLNLSRKGNTLEVSAIIVPDTESGNASTEQSFLKGRLMNLTLSSASITLRSA